ncbi:MAG: hypothetical protein JOY54_20755 [Acidobacteriaceae bacterium]|nr:hypothetical protein [Acidobacteriaceae bacterium]
MAGAVTSRGSVVLSDSEVEPSVHNNGASTSGANTAEGWQKVAEAHKNAPLPPQDQDPAQQTQSQQAAKAKRPAAPDYTNPLNTLNQNPDNRWVPYGGGQSRKYVNVSPASANAAETKKSSGTKIDALFTNSVNLHNPKSFDNERTTQALRHISSTAYGYLRSKGLEPQEVQSSIANGKIYISANTNAANKALEALTKDEKGKPLSARASLEKMTQGARQFAGSQKGAVPERANRHVEKLESRLLGDKRDSRYGNIHGVLGSPMQVPPRVKTKEDGLHAERRIADVLGDNFERAAGLKRPCATCNNEIYNGQSASGPWWSSKASNRRLDLKNDDQDGDLAKIANGRQTTATKTRAGEITFDVDTESDSDTETQGGTSAKRKLSGDTGNDDEPATKASKKG